MPVRLGLERLLDGPDRKLIAGQRIGLVCNPASIDSRIVHASDRLASGDWTLTALFGPQHGFHSDLQENMIESPHAQDAKRRVPVHSLYSETREPTGEMLADIDVLVIDLQDVGTRIYTYIYTMANCLRAARAHGVRVVVCDRPNPINGDDIEGATLDPALRVVRRAVPDPDAARPDDRRGGAALQRSLRPQRRRRRRPDGRLEAVDVLRRDRTAVGPAVAQHSDARHARSSIPGGVLFEGTLLSEGRGTNRPFEFIGAPWIDGDRFAAAMNARGICRASYFRPVFFEPTFHKHTQQAVRRVPDARHRSRGLPLDARGGRDARRVQARKRPAQTLWRDPPYEYEHVKPPIDILYGSDRLRRGDRRRRDARVDHRGLGRETKTRFRELREKYLFY